jgi:hypothetical protein
MTDAQRRARRWSGGIDEGLRHGWPALLALALLPVAASVSGPQRIYAGGGVLLVVLLAWVGTMTRHPRLPAGVALLAKSSGSGISAWEVGLLAFAVAVGVAYVVKGSQGAGVRL